MTDSRCIPGMISETSSLIISDPSADMLKVFSRRPEISMISMNVFPGKSLDGKHIKSLVGNGNGASDIVFS